MRLFILVLVLSVACSDQPVDACVSTAECQDDQICINGACTGVDASLSDVPVDLDSCLVGPDSDGDGVTDACDVCVGFDDGADDDGDGVADACDDWPCGIRPVISGLVSGNSIVVSNVDIAEQGNTIALHADEPFELEFDWTLNDEECPNCIDQVEIGFTRTGRIDCVYDSNPPPEGASGNARIAEVVLPAEAVGIYELRFALGQGFSCDNEDSDWFGDEPGEEHTVGVVCVPPAGIATPF